MPTLSREMAPADRFAEAAARYPAEASAWLVLTASYYERFLDHPEQRPERAAFFRDLLEGRGGFEVAARFRQQGWRRPAAEFLDPEIVVLKRTATSCPTLDAGRGSGQAISTAACDCALADGRRRCRGSTFPALPLEHQPHLRRSPPR